jgi:hypothetical protein
MGCFEDYMQFRDEVEEAKEKIRDHEQAKNADKEKIILGMKKTSLSLNSKLEQR